MYTIVLIVTVPKLLTFRSGPRYFKCGEQKVHVAVVLLKIRTELSGDVQRS